ncbi:MAG TPA: ABC transporter ATP-binding protein [Acidimicrobiales bacterium]|nr:ABC transporter ATP-binding protein [Acidimicrobiales bacterium]
MSAAPTGHWRAIGALLRPHARRYALLAAVLGLGAALPLAGPLVLRAIVDGATGDADVADLVGLAGIYLLVAVAGQLVAVLVAWVATTTAWTTTNELRLRLTGQVLGLDHEFHRAHTAGELIQRIDGDVTSVSDFLSRVVVKVGSAALLVVGMVAVLVVIDWRIGAAMAAYVAVAVAVVAARRDRAVGEASEEMGALARLYGGIEERLTASEDLRANGAGPHALWRFVEESAACLRTAVTRERAYLHVWRAINLAVVSGGVLALGGGAALVGRGTITIGTAFLLFQYTQLLRRPLEEVMDQLQVVQKANGGMLRVLELLAERPSIVDAGRTSPPPGPLGVDLVAVGFHYGDHEPVLRDVTLRLAPGRSLGVVGRTGSGKTTISRLVLRLVEATEGEVRLGGVPLADIPVDELRRRVALVPQEVQLFAGTVRDNVTVFDPRFTTDAVEAALGHVGLDHLVAAGVDRLLGPGGSGLSAGEGQLLALARVWLRDPDLVVLDEATARVDPATEERIESAIAELLRGRTVIAIAHRLSTLRHVDEIAVIDGGRVVEHGERLDLTADDSTRYAELLRLSASVLPEVAS